MAMGQPVVSAPAAVVLIQLHQREGYLGATIDRHVLEGDFILRVQSDTLMSVGENPGWPETRPAVLPGRDVSPGATVASGVFHLRQVGMSLVLSEYVGTVGGALHYRRRATMPILGRTPAGAFLIEGTPLWRALEPPEPGERASAGVFQLSATGQCDLLTIALARTPTQRAPWSRASILVRSLAGGRRVRYRIAVQLLPREPMRPRLRDWRIRFMPPLLPGDNVGQFLPDPYIWRWRLDKQVPSASVSDVVHPIVVQIAADVPRRWVSAIRRGVDAWTPVFDAIGFRHALVVQDAAHAGPVPDGRVIQISWNSDTAVGSPHAVASTSHDTDPRTGEILSASIVLSDSIAAADARSPVVYGALAPSAAPMPDTVLGLWLTAVVTHEMGHALGLDHNPKGATAYPPDSLRSRAFVRRVGAVSSIMASAFYNWIAQPEDGIPLVERIARLGAYDRWVIAWGYRPIPDAPTPEAERPTLNAWLVTLDTAPALRAGQYVTFDPSDKLHVLGNDPVTGAVYTIRNLAHAAAGFDPRRDAAPGEQTGVDGVEPRSLYATVSGRWRSTVAWALSVVGGVTPQVPYPVAHDSLRLLPIDTHRQVEALHFVLAHMFEGQDELIGNYVLLNPSGDSAPLVLFDTVAPGWQAAQWRTIQQTVLRGLVNRARLGRAPPAVRHEVCDAVRTLQQWLARAMADAAVPARQQQAQTLRTIADEAFASAAGEVPACPR